MSVRVRFPSGAHDPSRFPRGIFVYAYMFEGWRIMAEGRSFMPFKHRHFSNSLAASQLQNLTMFEGLKNLPFEHKTMPFEHLGRIVLSGSERVI